MQLALGLNDKLLILSSGGCCTSLVLHRIVATSIVVTECVLSEYCDHFHVLSRLVPRPRPSCYEWQLTAAGSCQAWLGWFLGLGMAETMDSERAHPDTSSRRMTMLKKWMRKQTIPSWEMVIFKELEKMSEQRLAHQLRVKYCIQQVTQAVPEERVQDSTGKCVCACVCV